MPNVSNVPNLPRLRSVWAGVLALANVSVAGTLVYLWEVAEWQAQASVFLAISVWTYIATWAYFLVTKQVIKHVKPTGGSLNA